MNKLPSLTSLGWWLRVGIYTRTNCVNSLRSSPHLKLRSVYMPVTNINSDWMFNASSGLCINAISKQVFMWLQLYKVLTLHTVVCDGSYTCFTMLHLADHGPNNWQSFAKFIRLTHAEWVYIKFISPFKTKALLYLGSMVLQWCHCSSYPIRNIPDHRSSSPPHSHFQYSMK